MSYFLHIETATKVCSVALSKDGQLIDHTRYVGDGFVHSEMLTSIIEQLFLKNKLPINRLSAISVSGGPGSYTGLRIGVSTAKGLCYALSIPLIAIDSLYSLAAWAKENEPDFTGFFCAMIDARRMEVFSAIFTHDLQLEKPISADILEENSYFLFSQRSPILLVGDGVEKTKEIWCERKDLFFSEIQSDARGQVKICAQRFLANQFVDVAYYEPFYLKDFVAGKNLPS
jgi:tRNA threonylcarbamoyladenosine biosynthesis protein TsaB